MLAALASAQLDRLEGQTQRRSENGRYLADLLEDVDGLSSRREDAYVTRNANHLHIVRYDPEGFDGLPRSRFIEAMQAEGIGIRAGYARPMNRADLFSDPNGELSLLFGREATEDPTLTTRRCRARTPNVPVPRKTCGLPRS